MQISCETTQVYQNTHTFTMTSYRYQGCGGLELIPAAKGRATLDTTSSQGHTTFTRNLIFVKFLISHVNMFTAGPLQEYLLYFRDGNISTNISVPVAKWLKKGRPNYEICIPLRPVQLEENIITLRSKKAATYPSNLVLFNIL